MPKYFSKWPKLRIDRGAKTTIDPTTHQKHHESPGPAFEFQNGYLEVSDADAVELEKDPLFNDAFYRDDGAQAGANAKYVHGAVTATGVPNPKIAELEDKNKALAGENEDLKRRVAELESKAAESVPPEPAKAPEPQVPADPPKGKK